MRGRIWAVTIAVVVLVAAAAGFGGYELGLRANRPGLQASSVSPSPTAALRTGSPTSAATPTPTAVTFPTSGAPVAVNNLQCKLPVYQLGQNGSGAFISFPSGAVTRDSTSNVNAPGSSMGQNDPGDWYALSYDSAVSRWLPVPYSWVKPDGTLYVYAMDWLKHAGANPIVEVNAQTGTDAILQGQAPNVGGGWTVIAVSANYVYAISPRSQGLYSVPFSGPSTNQSYVSDGFWTAASGFYAYGSAIPDGGAIVRVDTRDPTQRVPWFNKASSAQILGFDGSGNPVIWTGSDLWIASSPTQATRISSKPPLTAPALFQMGPVYGTLAPVSDSHGLWLSTTDGIYLYAGGQTTKVSNVVAQVAGPCI